MIAGINLRITKHWLKSGGRKEKVIVDITLKMYLELAFANLRRKFPNITYRLKEAIIKGIIILLLNVYQETMKKETIKRAFTCCWQYCDADFKGATVSLRVMMSQCYGRW